MSDLVRYNYKLPLRMASFYSLYCKFLKERGGRWHDVLKLLAVIADVVFDVSNVDSKLGTKVSF